MAAVTTPSSDPIIVRRRRIQRLAEIGQRVGYALFGLAIVVFFVGFVSGLDDVHVTIIVAAMVVGSAFLAPAIVAGYAVKAADREDRQHGRPI
jgi:hypothetical protein